MKSILKFLFLSLVITNCGGGTNESENLSQFVDEPSIPLTIWQKDVFLPASDFKNKCSIPRTGINPSTNTSYPDTKGQRLDENNFFRAYSNNTYL